MSNYPKIKISPTANDVFVVEKYLKNMDDSVISLKEFKNSVKLDISNKELMEIIEYLDYKNKIYLGKKGITWIENNSPKLKKAIAEGYSIL